MFTIDKFYIRGRLYELSRLMEVQYVLGPLDHPWRIVTGTTKCDYSSQVMTNLARAGVNMFEPWVRQREFPCLSDQCRLLANSVVGLAALLESDERLVCCYVPYCGNPRCSRRIREGVGMKDVVDKFKECAYCKAILHKELRYCSSCHWAYYCDEGCQRLDRQNHKKDCIRFATLQRMQYTPGIRPKSGKGTK